MPTSIKSMLCLAVMAIAPMVASAHAHLDQAQPANGSVVNSPPSEVMLMFSAPVTLTSLAIEKAGMTGAQKLSPLPTGAAKHLTVPLPKLSDGAYTIRYRAASADGHVMNGDVKLAVSATGEGKASMGPGPAAAGNKAHSGH